MKLVEIQIENYRGIRNVHIPIDGLTVFVGENNIGKSTVLESTRMALTRGFFSRRGGFSEYDFHLQDANATPQTAQPIKIMLHFAEETVDEWPDEIIQQMGDVIQLDTAGLNHIWFQMAGNFNSASSSFETNWSFLNSSGVELQLKNSTPLN